MHLFHKFVALALAFGFTAPSAAVPYSASSHAISRGLHSTPMDTSFIVGRDSASSSQSQSVPVLLPAVHWNYPVDDPRNLLPSDTADLYYSYNATSDPSVQHFFASASSTFQHNSVILDHSSFVASVSCDNSSILVTFNSAESQSYAGSSWAVAENFVLVTSSNDCGASQDVFTFFLIESVQQINGTMSILAIIEEELTVENAFGEINLTWGMYYPPSTSDNTTLLSRNAKQRTRSHDSHQNRENSQHHRSLDKRLSVSATGNISAVAPNTDQSPWGPATLIFSLDGVELYCVDCAFQALVEITGTANLKILSGEIDLQLGVNASLDASFGLGLVGKAGFEDTKTKNIFQQAIPELGFSIIDLVTAGVFVTINASATLGIEADGEALIGIDMTIPDFQAVIDHDLGDDADSPGASSVNRYNSTFGHTFNASGSITASARLALPVALNFGLEIPRISTKTIALIETPSLFGNITFADNTTDAPQVSESCNDGFEFLINAQNDVDLNLFDLKTFNLNHIESPAIAQGCFQP